MTDKMKTPITYYGGKQSMARHILPLIPEHETYTETFFGGGAIFWLKPQSKIEVINDLNGSVINFYKVLKHSFPELKQAIETTVHSRLLYKKAMLIYDMPHLFNPVQQAWAFWVGTNMGFSSQVGSWAFDYFGKTERKMQNKVEGFTDIYSQRLQQTCIEHNDATRVIATRDKATTFHYVDPPYVGTSMGHYAGYTQYHFTELLETLAQCKGKFLLSSYPNTELAKFVKKHKWYQQEVDMFISAGKAKDKRKIEVLTANYKI